jgi:hypothetical protein
MFPTAVLRVLQQGVLLRERFVKGELKRLKGSGFPNAVQELQDELKLIDGDGPKRPGIKAWIGVEDDKSKPKPDPNQLDIEIQIDEQEELLTDTWSLTVDGVRKLVAETLQDEAPESALALIERYIEGEQQKDGGPRSGALDALRSARESLEQSIQREESKKKGGLSVVQ